jgi:hypothetical protein
MRDIATATMTGNLTREVELRPLPSGIDVAWPAGRVGAGERSGSRERTTSRSRSTARRQTCAPSAWAKARASWSAVSSIGGNGPTRGRTGARLSCSGHARSCSRAGVRARGWGWGVRPTNAAIRRMASPRSVPRRHRRPQRMTRRSEQSVKPASRPTAGGGGTQACDAPDGNLFCSQGRSSTSGTGDGLADRACWNLSDALPRESGGICVSVRTTAATARAKPLSAGRRWPYQYGDRKPAPAAASRRCRGWRE